MTPPEAFWPWAVRTYARGKVRATCLDLQDRHGHSVPYLLWAAWSALQGRACPDAVLTRGAGLARTWGAEVVEPLRQVRQRLRGRGQDELRDRVKAVELEAERALMAELEALTPPASSLAGAEAALFAAGRIWDPAADPRPLKHFASILE